MHNHPSTQQSTFPHSKDFVLILTPLTPEGQWRHTFRASFRFGRQQIDATCSDYQFTALEPHTLTETLRDEYFTDVALCVELATRISKPNVYLTDLPYEVDSVAYELRAPQVVGVEGTLGALHLHKPITILLIAPMARRGESFTLHFGKASTEMTLPPLSHSF